MNQLPDEPIDAVVVEDTVDEPDGTVALPTTMPSAPYPPQTELVTDYTDGGLPTFDYVRERIEGRFNTSVGAAELAGNTRPAAEVEDKFAAREKAGQDRLEQIRRAMREE